LSRKGAKSRTHGRKLRSTGTKTTTRVGRIPESPADLQQQLESCRRELAEAREQQAATLEVLKIISSSPGDLTSVFDAILERATELCEATHGHVWRFDGEQLYAVAVRGDPQFVGWLRQHSPVRPIAGSAAERIVRGERAWSMLPTGARKMRTATIKYFGGWSIQAGYARHCRLLCAETKHCLA
jgi:hypothetical protein